MLPIRTTPSVHYALYNPPHATPRLLSKVQLNVLHWTRTPPAVRNKNILERSTTILTYQLCFALKVGHTRKGRGDEKHSATWAPSCKKRNNPCQLHRRRQRHSFVLGITRRALVERSCLWHSAVKRWSSHNLRWRWWGSLPLSSFTRRGAMCSSLHLGASEASLTRGEAGMMTKLTLVKINRALWESHKKVSGAQFHWQVNCRYL